jgi:hypothetical protein
LGRSDVGSVAAGASRPAAPSATDQIVRKGALMSRRPALFRTAPGVRRSPLPLLAGLAVIATGLLLAACGGSSPSSTSSTASEQQAEVKLADFAKCMREHGIEATTSTGPGGEGHGLSIKGTGGPAKVEAVQKDCKKYAPAPQKLNLSPQEKVARAEAVEKFAKCMREHGIEVHASGSEGHISIQIHGGPGAGGPNPESPAFQKAQSTCQKLLPGAPKGGRGSPKSGTASSSPSGGGNFSSESFVSAGG